ncbi:MAG: radical SAM protein [Candidatus Omnitrophota bacterium]
MFRGIYSQINNLLAFRGLFSLRQILSAGNRFPVTVNFLITNNCNLDCSICSAHSMLNKAEALPAADIICFIKKIARYKPAVFFGGGEPFIRKDIFEILHAVKQCNLKYGLVTNGTLLDQDKIKKLFNVEPEVVIFSVHGDELGHDAKTGKKGAYSALSRAIELSVAHRKKAALLLNSVITPDNYYDLEDIIAQGKRLGVDRVRFEQLIFLSRDEYKQHLAACDDNGLLTEKEAEMTTYIKDINQPGIGIKLQKEVSRLKKKYGNFIIFKPYLTAKEREKWFANNFDFDRKCMFVRHSVFIKANGDIIPCQFFSDYILGNIKTGELSDVWQNQKRREFSAILSKKILPGCVRCCKL